MNPIKIDFGQRKFKGKSRCFTIVGKSGDDPELYNLYLFDNSVLIYSKEVTLRTVCNFLTILMSHVFDTLNEEKSSVKTQKKITEYNSLIQQMGMYQVVIEQSILNGVLGVEKIFLQEE